MLPKAIEQAWKLIAPLWPLNQAIARNPLHGFEELPFDKAVEKATHFFANDTLPEPLKKINRHTIKWCQSYFDTGQATITLPFKDKGLFSAFEQLAHYETQLNSKFITNLDTNPEQVIKNGLEQLNITPENTVLFLQLLLTTLPGWAGYVKYLAIWNEQKQTTLLTEYLALRITLVTALWPQAAELIPWHHKQQPAAHKKTVQFLHTIDKAEKDVTKKCIETLQQPITNTKNPEVQFLFCIDVRSATLRKALETAGPFETFGVAGFFGLPIALTISHNNTTHATCPVIIKPTETVIKKVPTPSSYQLKKAYQSVKYTQVSPLALAEGAGLWTGIWMAFKTIAPTFTARIKTLIKCTLNQNYKAHYDISALSLEQQITYAANLLLSIGLIDKFAQKIVLCGHGATTTNNPYQSSFDCGACAGHNGVDNARIAAKILNNHEVRTGLQKEGIIIPHNTTFLSAQHNTTQQKLIFDNPDAFSQSHHKAFNAATKTTKKQQKAMLGSSLSLTNRSNDWAQTRPEWGLAGNHLFIIGPRSASQHRDLKNSTFLHSYDWKKDTDGSILEAIMNGPLIVAQWINAHYLFSSLDNSLYGAGNKVTHNITGKIGAMQGNASDLCLGLSYQSIYDDAGNRFHQPIRLTALIYAPAERVNTILIKNKTLQQLVDNKWIFIKAM